MSEQESNPSTGEGGSPEGGDDPIKNMKMEMDRKLKNISEENNSRYDSLKKANDELINVLSANNNKEAQQAESKSSDDEIDDAWFSDPTKAKDLLERRILDKVEKQNIRMQQTQQSQQVKFNELASDFPELYQSNSDLVKKAGEYYNKLTDSQRNSSEFIENTVLKAAFDLGLRPKKHRDESESEFVGSSKQPNRSSKDQDGVTEFQKTFAEAIGRPVKDESYQKRLEKYSKRKNWTAYQGEIE